MVIQEDVNMDVGEGQATHVVDSSDSEEPEEEDRVSLTASKAGNPIPNPPHTYSLRSANNLLAPSTSALQKGINDRKGVSSGKQDGRNDGEGAQDSQAVRVEPGGAGRKAGKGLGKGKRQGNPLPLHQEPLHSPSSSLHEPTSQKEVGGRVCAVGKGKKKSKTHLRLIYH